MWRCQLRNKQLSPPSSHGYRSRRRASSTPRSSARSPHLSNRRSPSLAPTPPPTRSICRALHSGPTGSSSSGCAALSATARLATFAAMGSARSQRSRTGSLRRSRRSPTSCGSPPPESRRCSTSSRSVTVRCCSRPSPTECHSRPPCSRSRPSWRWRWGGGCSRSLLMPRTEAPAFEACVPSWSTSIASFPSEWRLVPSCSPAAWPSRATSRLNTRSRRSTRLPR